MYAARVGCHSLVLIFVIMCLSQSVTCKTAPLHVKSETDRVPGQYIVVLKDDVDVDSFATSFEYSVRSGETEGKIRHTYRHTIKGFSAQLSPKTLTKLRDSKHVKFIEEDSIVRASTISSWGLGRVDQRDLPLDSNEPNYLGRGENTHIYVIDTGTSKTHSEFTGRFSDIGFDVIDDPPQVGFDCDGHGTHCAGTAAGETYGVATEATIHSVRVLGCDGSGTSEGVIAGMDWVAENATGQQAIVSMSLGGPVSQASNDAVKRLFEAGIVVSVAAGNENTDACDVSPASAPEAITVGATDNSDTRADFSNYGSCVDIFAPGVSITSSVHEPGDDSTGTYSGTSMACPHVSGAAAVLLGVAPNLTPTEVTAQLLRGSTPNKVSDSRSVNRLLYIGSETCMTRCGAAQDGSGSCQCDAACPGRNDCCSDYQSICGDTAPSCKDRCDTSDDGPCMCDEECTGRGDCCADYVMECQPDLSNCQGSMNEEGVITSPNYPNEYSGNELEHTCIAANDGEKVVLTFLNFDVEYEENCEYDMLRIYDGSDGNSPLLGVYCGGLTQNPAYIKSSGPNVYTVFQSDGSVEDLGYQIEVSFTGLDGCDVTVDEENYIASPNYPYYYLENQDFRICINAAAGETVRLVFYEFDVEFDDDCSYDSLSVYDGSDDSSPLLETYCGTLLDVPLYVDSTGSSMFLVFKSDDSIQDFGYEAYVEFISGSAKNMVKPTFGIPEIFGKPTFGTPEKKDRHHDKGGYKSGKGKQKPGKGIPKSAKGSRNLEKQ